MAEKMNLARIKRFGMNFEIGIDPDKALLYKKGEITDVDDVVKVDRVFSDLHKGQEASRDQLQKAFVTDDFNKVADFILKHGEIQLSTEHRAQEREQRYKKLVFLIHRNAVDPKTGYPHPPERIERALEEGKIHLDEHKTVEEQFPDIISKLRPIIPISIQQKILRVVIPVAHTGRSYPVIKKNSKILKEEWNSDGSLSMRIEIPAGFQQELISLLNAITHGDLIIENE